MSWLGRRSLAILAALPILLFVAAAVALMAVASLLAHRSPIGDTYVMAVIGAVLAGGFVMYFACIYVLAALFIRTRRFKLLELHQSLEEIQALSWREFEDLVAASYYSRGYDVETRGGDRPDGGVDLIVRKGGGTWMVQCKHKRWVDVRAARELLGVVTAQKATGGVLVACGVFDERALEFAKATDKLELIGGEKLQSLIASTAGPGASEIPCPKCGSEMRQKSGKFGPFLGCVNYPSCHGWRQLNASSSSSGSVPIKP